MVASRKSRIRWQGALSDADPLCWRSPSISSHAAVGLSSWRHTPLLCLARLLPCISVDYTCRRLHLPRLPFFLHETTPLPHDPSAARQLTHKEPRSWRRTTSANMAARSRPRGQLKEEFDEERVIWNSIKSDGRRVDQLMVWDFSIKPSSALMFGVFCLCAQWAMQHATYATGGSRAHLQCAIVACALTAGGGRLGITL